MSETAVSLRLCDALAKLKGRNRADPNLRIGYMGLSLGPQDPRGSPTNCIMHRVNSRYMII